MVRGPQARYAPDPQAARDIAAAVEAALLAQAGVGERLLRLPHPAPGANKRTMLQAIDLLATAGWDIDIGPDRTDAGTLVVLVSLEPEEKK